MSNVPNGFTTTKKQSGLFFQSASNWKKVDLTGRMIQGIYEGRMDEDAFQKRNYKFTATEPGSTITADGETKDYAAGDVVIINESGGLNAQMDGIVEGTEVIVDYDGAVTMKKGKFKGKQAHSFTVYTKAS